MRSSGGEAVGRAERPIVEWFAKIDQWSTARKTLWLSAAAILAQSVVAAISVLLLDVWGGVDTGRIIVLMGGGFAVLAASFAASLLAVRSSREGSWTAYLIILGYGLWITFLVQALGSWSTPFFAAYPLTVVLIALYYGERLGWFAFVAGAAMLAFRQAIEAGGLMDYAPALVNRSVDDQQELAWVAVNAFIVMSYFVFCFAISILVVATRRMQDRRLRSSHDELAASNEQIARTNELISRYAPREVADRVLTGEHSDDPRPERLKLTIVFSDVVGFTDSSDEMDPEELADFLNDYLAQMSDIADRHGASINQFIGDGIMIFFGAPRTTDDRDNAKRAVRMALEMQESMAGLNSTWLQRGGRRNFQVRIGINTGYASVGDFGSPGRKAYSAIGVQVNVAARIESVCPPGRILVSDTTWALVGGEFDGTDRGEVNLKGIHFPVRVYEIEPAADVTPASL
jgi:class 3 adenylate cyclase